jgi:hypothetical protein
MDPMTSPSREEQPMTASLDSEAKVRLATAHLPVMSKKSVNFEPAGYSLREFGAIDKKNLKMSPNQGPPNEGPDPERSEQRQLIHGWRSGDS